MNTSTSFLVRSLNTTPRILVLIVSKSTSDRAIASGGCGGVTPPKDNTFATPLTSDYEYEYKDTVNTKTVLVLYAGLYLMNYGGNCYYFLTFNVFVHIKIGRYDNKISTDL